MKYLPDNGWDINVLSVKNGNHSIMDESLLAEINPSVSVFRTGTLESLFKRSSSEKQVTDVKDHVENTGRSPLRAMYKNWGRYIKVPDSRILWIPTALPYGLYRILRDRYDVLFATGPSFTNLVLAAILSKLTRRPLVVDFRDAWTADPMLPSQEIGYLWRSHVVLERTVIRSAALVVTTNPYVTADFAKRYSEKNSAAFKTLYNGYDRDDFSFLDSLQPAPSTGKYRIVYTGRLYGERTPEHFLRAVSLTLDRAPELKNKIEVVLVGSAERFLDGCVVEDYIRELGLGKNVVLTGHVARKESFRLQVEADLLLLLIGIVPVDKELTYGISGKVFDYLLSKKPILTLADGGATREFIRENNIGYLFRHGDTGEIADFLIAAVQDWVAGKDPVIQDVDQFPQFEFKAIAEALGSSMSKLTNR